jgi:uncharacterized protein YaaN involved in tellurite resistance
MEVVDPEAVKAAVAVESKPEPAETAALRKQAEGNAQAILDVNLDSMRERTEILQSVESFGLDTMQRSSKKNALLSTTVGKLSQSGGEGGQVSKSLADLSRTVKELDPSGLDFTKRGFLGKMFNPIRAYFERYEKAEDVIAGVLQSLEKGRAMLKNDNTTLSIEQQALRDLTKQIQKQIELGAMMDEYVAAKIEEARASGSDAERIRFMEEEALFPLRQRVMDMQQMAVVNQQGIIAMEVVQRNNKELMRGVDRAKNVTVSALRTAVMVASALYDQKIVLKKIQALNETTNAMISQTSRMLKEQGADIQRQSMETGVSVDTLRTAFDDAVSALDQISEYKQQALPVMKETIAQFRQLADEGETRIQRLERGSRLGIQG